MDNSNIDEHKEVLQQRAKILEERLRHIKRDVISPTSTKFSEQAQERENDEVVDAIGNSAREELSLIYKALERQQKGQYGLCQRCHKKISNDRLSAVPEAELCANCAA